MSAAIETARQQWEEGHRRLEALAPERRRYERLLAEVELVAEELARRVGHTFALADLARTYAEADRWVGEVVVERALPGFHPQDLATAQDAAFHLYARGARDFAP